MPGLGDNYLCGLGDDGVLTQAASYDGFVFDALREPGKFAILAQVDPVNDGVPADSDAATSYFSNHAALSGVGDTIDLVDLARGLFATHQSTLDGAAFYPNSQAEHHSPPSAAGADFDAQVAPPTLPFDVPASIDLPSLGMTPDALADLQELVHLAVQTVFEHTILGFVPVDVEHNLAGFAPVDII